MISFLLHLTTFIFFLCKIFSVAPVAYWSWWLVFTPSLIAIGIAVLAISILIIAN